MTHMLNLDEQMTGLKRKPSDLPGDQPPPKLLKQTTSTGINTVYEIESDIDNVPPPVLEKADSFIDVRPKTVPIKDHIRDDGSNSSTPPPVLPRFPTLTPTKLAQPSDKYFGFEIPSDDEDDDDDDDTINKLADSIYVGESENESKSKTMCTIGTNTLYDSNGTNGDNPELKRADTVVVSESNGSNGEGKKKLFKKGIVKKVLSPKKGINSKKDTELKKEKSVLLDSLESLRTIQKFPSGTIIEKIMKFGAEEIILPSEKSLAVYEDDESKTTNSSLNSSSLLQRPSIQIVTDTLKSVEGESESIPKLDCVSSEELSTSELSDLETHSTIPSLQKMTVMSPTKSPKKFIHGGIREIVFSFDTTGSMYTYMEETKDKLRELIGRLKIDIPGVRLAFIAHGDYYDLKNDRYLVKCLNFGATVDEICDFFEYLPITHGGDADECYELVLRKVRDSLSWTTGSQRCLVMIGDSDPHEPGYEFEQFVNDIDWREETKKLNEMGVRIYGMQVGYRSDFYRQISQMTGGAHLRLENAELTPDMLMSVCLREGNLKLLKTYEAEVMKRPEYKTGLDLELARLFSSLKNVPDNIAMKFKKNMLEGTVDKENGKKVKAVKRGPGDTLESPGSKIAKLAKKALSADGKSPDKEKIVKKMSVSDKIAKNLIKKAIKGTKEKKMPNKKLKTPLKKDKTKVVTKGTKKTDTKEKKKSIGNKEKKKTPVKSIKDGKKKLTKPKLGVKKPKTIVTSKINKKNVPKSKQMVSKIKAKAVMKALMKDKKSPVKNKLPMKVKKNPTKPTDKTKTKVTTKPKTVSKVKTKETSKKVSKPKIKSEDIKKKPSKTLKDKKKETLKPKPEKKVASKKTVEKKVPQKKTEKETKKTASKKETTSKKSTPAKTAQTKRPKNLQPREIASIAKFVTGPLSSSLWEPWCTLIAHEKQKTGNWTKGKNGCPGYCNSDLNNLNSPVPVMYEYAVSPPDSSKKYPVCFSDNENVWNFHEDKYIQGELDRVIKAKGSISVRKGTVNRDDDTLFFKTVENIKNMFDYAWNSNSSKETVRKTDLVKEGFVIAKV